MDCPSIGLELSFVHDIDEVVGHPMNKDYNYFVAPLVHPRASRDFAGILPARKGPLTRSDLCLPSGEWNSRVTGKVSNWLNFDSEHDWIRSNSEQAFSQELAWAAHLGLGAVIVNLPINAGPNFARCINQALQTSYLQIWIQLPIGTNNPENPGWRYFRRLRTICESHKNLGILLELGEDLPTELEINRWIGEPVKGLMFPSAIFLTNKGGFPVLSKKHQNVLNTFLNYKIHMLISGRISHPKGPGVYVSYLKHIWQSKPELSEEEYFELPYRDYLQVPLQPLADNLESQTYEVFEKDPVKYVQYEEAVYQALIDRKAAHFPDRVPVVMVVGAGRGPLVRASLRASDRAAIPIRVWAVEKNPNAVITLENLVESEGWEGKVTVVSVDMRKWNAPEKADIMVSELLGSFGDNELSPECLDGAQAFLRDDGISIPSAYTSFIAPIQSVKLHQEVKSFNSPKHFETTYVVLVHARAQLAKAQTLFTFVHPNRAAHIDNNRYKTLDFEMKIAATVHGFAGFFDAELYKSVHISINPETFSTGMFSWFPLLLPLKVPVDVEAGQTLSAAIWRNCTSTKVWYEWGVLSPQTTDIHNPNGRSQNITL